jgi:hypothetical protein
MFENPIFIYSEYCNYSSQFNQALEKYPELFQSFIRVSVDVDPRTQQRSPEFYDIQYALGQAIKEVPTIIIKQGEYVLSGQEAFKWLEHTINENTDKELEGFNPNEMGSFSDSYASVGAQGLHDATEQTFKFIRKPDEKIKTPPEAGGATTDDYDQKQRRRQETNMKRLAPEVDFSKDKMFKGEVASPKQKDIDARLQELIAEREGAQTAPKQRKNVNFSSGEFY